MPVLEMGSDEESVASDMSERLSDDEMTEAATMRSICKGCGGSGPADALLGGVAALVGRIVSTVEGWGVNEEGELIRLSL